MIVQYFWCRRICLIICIEQGIDLTQSYNKTPTLTEKSNKQRDNKKNATKHFDYTAIADWLRTVSWRNNVHAIGEGW